MGYELRYIENRFAPLKDTKEAKEIVWNLSRIQYLFFHVRNNAGERQHLFHVYGLAIRAASDIGDLYKAPSNAGRYVVVNFDQNFELNAASLNASLMSYESKTRYDPQFVSLDTIKVGGTKGVADAVQ